MEALLLQPVKSGFMRHTVNVTDVLALFPDRKKSWAYNLLAGIRAATGKLVVTVAELAEYTGEAEDDVRAAIRSKK